MTSMRFLRWNKHWVWFLLPLILYSLLYLDKSVLLWIKNFYAANPEAQQIDHAVRYPIRILSHGATILTLSIGLYLFGGSLNRTLGRAGRSLLIGYLSSGVAVQILKHLFGRARPSVTFDTLFIGPTMQYGHDSFPSGHATTAFCFAFILSGYFPRYRLAFYLFGVVAGLYRIDGLSHFLSDVLAGALLGMLVGKIVRMKSSGQAYQVPGAVHPGSL
jgi:membrane-associated phospholipid phosphatase